MKARVTVLDTKGRPGGRSDRGVQHRATRAADLQPRSDDPGRRDGTLVRYPAHQVGAIAGDGFVAVQVTTPTAGPQEHGPFPVQVVSVGPRARRSAIDRIPRAGTYGRVDQPLMDDVPSRRNPSRGPVCPGDEPHGGGRRGRRVDRAAAQVRVPAVPSRPAGSAVGGRRPVGDDRQLPEQALECLVPDRRLPAGTNLITLQGGPGTVQAAVPEPPRNGTPEVAAAAARDGVAGTSPAPGAVGLGRAAMGTAPCLHAPKCTAPRVGGVRGPRAWVHATTWTARSARMVGLVRCTARQGR